MGLLHAFRGFCFLQGPQGKVGRCLGSFCAPGCCADAKWRLEVLYMYTYIYIYIYTYIIVIYICSIIIKYLFIYIYIYMMRVYIYSFVYLRIYLVKGSLSLPEARGGV